MNIRQLLPKKKIAVLEQPPYSPDLTPSDYFLFPKLKGFHQEGRDDGAEENSGRFLPEVQGGAAKQEKKGVRQDMDYFEG